MKRKKRGRKGGDLSTGENNQRIAFRMCKTPKPSPQAIETNVLAIQAEQVEAFVTLEYVPAKKRVMKSMGPSIRKTSRSKAGDQQEPNILP